MEININKGSDMKVLSTEDNHGRPITFFAKDNRVLLSMKEESGDINRQFSKQEFDEIISTVCK